MPGLNGCDFLKYLQNEHLHMPVILLQRMMRQKAVMQQINYGVLAYLTKPVDGEVLLDLLRNATNQTGTFN